MKTLEQIKDEFASKNGYKDFVDIIDMAPSSVTNETFDKIAELYAAQFKSEWVSVKERLPEDSETNVLASDVTNITIMRGAYLHYILKTPGTTSLIPEYWQPLPSPPTTRTHQTGTGKKSRTINSR